MYKIYADDTLIYDSTLEDYKIGKGSVTLETNKSGSFVFSIYPDHFYYDKFVQLKTVITVYKSGKIVFRGRILNDVTDYWNNKVITCEGELGFLQDSIIRPFTFNGTPENLFRKFVEEHNSQVDEFKRFKIGTVTVVDGNNLIARSNSSYESALSNLNSRLIEDSLGGYFYITHGADGTDQIPTINYLADFTKISTQKIEFGSNLKDYTKTVKAEEIATAIIPLGAEIDDGNDNTENPKLTIENVNGGKDYVYSAEGVALRGWIIKVKMWDDVTDASNLKRKAETYLEEVLKQNITIELNAIDLHLLDRTIESFNVCDYVQVISVPHNFNSTLLCNKQTLDLLKPDNDSLVLGYTYSTFTETSSKVSASVSSIPTIQESVRNMNNKLTALKSTVNDTSQTANSALNNYQEVDKALGEVSGDLEIIAGVVTDNARNIATNAQNIATNAQNISSNADDIEVLKRDVEAVAGVATENARDIADIKASIEDIISRLEVLEGGGNTDPEPDPGDNPEPGEDPETTE
jgi:phage minor structural protein